MSSKSQFSTNFPKVPDLDFVVRNRLPVLGPSAFTVYSILYFCAEKNRPDPRISDLTAWTGQNFKTIHRALTRLRNLGLLTVAREIEQSGATRRPVTRYSISGSGFLKKAKWQ